MLHTGCAEADHTEMLAFLLQTCPSAEVWFPFQDPVSQGKGWL